MLKIKNIKKIKSQKGEMELKIGVYPATPFQIYVIKVMGVLTAQCMVWAVCWVWLLGLLSHHTVLLHPFSYQLHRKTCPCKVILANGWPDHICMIEKWRPSQWGNTWRKELTVERIHHWLMDCLSSSSNDLSWRDFTLISPSLAVFFAPWKSLLV